ncbi:TolC family protein [Catalinimonas niigatensis]|uniref:TolC family protein n=1 Tax=Catalinimonas niigatensis TaxID=1397264 RepID=UPI002665D0AC|nr:TolC family protein [Catalinimonas niigatensis]WPP49908.1 TolC family protein [Catalinimonas niigatensis]
MKFTFLLTFLSLYICITTTLYAQQSDNVRAEQVQGKMTLEECLEYAYQNNATLKNAALEQNIAKADVGVTKADGLPQINGSISYNNNVAIQTQFLPAVFFADDPTEVPADAPAVPVQFGVQHTSNAGASISQMIFDGSYFVGLKAARTYADLMQKNFNQTKVDLAEQVMKAYYTVLVNEERQKLINSNFNRLDTLLNETRIMYENGFVEKIDVDRIRVQFNNAKTERDKTIRLTEVSYLLLKFQMGMPIDQEILLADNIGDINMDLEIEEEVNFEYSHRIDYATLQINRELVSLDLKNNRVQYLPGLTANASVGYNTGVNDFGMITDFSDQWFQYGFFGFNLDIPIFDGLRKHHRIQKNQLQLQQLENQTRQLENNIDLEIVQAKVSLQNSVETLAVQQENLELARYVFDVAKIKFQEGVGSNLEVITAEDELQTAETNYFSALYDALIAKVDLERALGNLIEK